MNHINNVALQCLYSVTNRLSWLLCRIHGIPNVTGTLMKKKGCFCSYTTFIQLFSLNLAVSSVRHKYLEGFQISGDWLYTSEAKRKVCHQDQLMAGTYPQGRKIMAKPIRENSNLCAWCEIGPFLLTKPEFFTFIYIWKYPFITFTQQKNSRS